MYTCIDKSMQIILERDSIDKPLTFNLTCYKSFFILVCSPITCSCKGVFNPNIPILASNSAEGLHFSAFHYNWRTKRAHPCLLNLPNFRYIYLFIYLFMFIIYFRLYVVHVPLTRKCRTGRLRFNGQYNRLENSYFSSKL